MIDHEHFLVRVLIILDTLNTTFKPLFRTQLSRWIYKCRKAIRSAIQTYYLGDLILQDDPCLAIERSLSVDFRDTPSASPSRDSETGTLLIDIL